MFVEDLSVFFNTAEHAVEATLQGVSSAIAVIFDNDFVQALGIVTSSGPAALAKASDVAAGDVGKTLTIGGVVYTIRDRRLQDDGAIVLLQLSAP